MKTIKLIKAAFLRVWNDTFFFHPPKKNIPSIFNQDVDAIKKTRELYGESVGVDVGKSTAELYTAVGPFMALVSIGHFLPYSYIDYTKKFVIKVAFCDPSTGNCYGIRILEDDICLLPTFTECEEIPRIKP